MRIPIVVRHNKTCRFITTTPDAAAAAVSRIVGVTYSEGVLQKGA
jgi:hypothetical protein